MTIAVDDMASAAPMTAAEAGARPSAQATPPSASVVTMTCARPSPKTSRRMRRRRSNDSSSPIVNRSATTPNAASSVDRFDLDRECAEPGRALASEPSP